MFTLYGEWNTENRASTKEAGFSNPSSVIKESVILAKKGI
jgi:hypothetical protein